MLKKHLKKIFPDIKAPKHISRNFKHISHDKQNELRAIIKQVYFGNLAYSQGVTSEDYLVTTEGKADVENHLSNRLSYFRHTISPWL
jgi:hypothetical protein